MHLILTGATGLVGTAALQHMLTLPAVTKVSILSRRPVPMAEGHSKATVIIHNDFNSYPPALLEQLKGAEGCVWAQGTSITNVKLDEYERITYDFPLAAAKSFSSLSDPFKFVYVSGEGATTTPGIFTPAFGKVKGAAEAALLALSKTYPSLKPFSIRPGMVDSSANPEIQKYIPQLKVMMRFGNATLGPLIRGLAPSMTSPTKELGKMLVELAMGDGKELAGEGITGEGRTANNAAQRRLAGL